MAALDGAAVAESAACAPSGSTTCSLSSAPSRWRRTTAPTRLGASTPIQQRTVEQIVHSPTQQADIPQERTSKRIMDLTVDVPVPQDTVGTEIEYMASAPAAAHAAEIEHMAPALHQLQ